jgi:hypothetical protein
LTSTDDFIPEPDDATLERIRSVLERVGGEHVVWGAQSSLDLLVTAHRMHAEEMASTRLTRATWVLAGAPIALVLATIVLVFVTVTNG